MSVSKEMSRLPLATPQGEETEPGKLNEELLAQIGAWQARGVENVIQDVDPGDSKTVFDEDALSVNFGSSASSDESYGTS